MSPRIVSDRAIEVVNGRTLRLWEQGELVTEWTFPAESKALEVGRAWLTYAEVAR